MDNNSFKVVEEEKLYETIRDSYLLDKVVFYNDRALRSIPAFMMAIDVKFFDVRKMSDPSIVNVSVCLGKKQTSYLVFAIETKGGERYKFALPMDSFVQTIPIIGMAREVRIVRHGSELKDKGQKKKDVLIIKLKGEALNITRVGITLMMDKLGLLKTRKSKVIDGKEPVQLKPGVVKVTERDS